MNWFFIIVFLVVICIFLNRLKNKLLGIQPVKQKHIVNYVLVNFKTLTEKSIANIELKLIKSAPKGDNPDIDLIYALRISKCVENINSFKTLASRYSTAHIGAGLRGLRSAEGSENYQIVADFLHKLYIEQFVKIGDDLIQKVCFRVANHLKTKKAKINTWSKAKKQIQDAYVKFAYGLPNAEEVIAALLEKIEIEMSAVRR